MRLAPRLALTFGLLAAVSTAGVGLAVRERLARKETTRFQGEVARICDRATEELSRQAAADHALIGGACQSGFLVDLVGSSLDRSDLDERRTAYSQMVRTERGAFAVDELLLGTEGGDIIGASPTSLLGMPAKDVESVLRGPAEHFTLRLGTSPAIVSRCTKRSGRGHMVGLVGARLVDPVLQRLARTLDVTVQSPAASGAPAPLPAAATGRMARASCRFKDEDGAVLAFDVLKSTKELDDNLHDVNETVGLYAAVSAAVAFVVAIFLARSLSRPLSELATEAGKVVAGEARPIRATGSGEVNELGAAFDRMIQDLAVTRRRLAAASRVAAWREVARRVAHEVKNPLAPIRAAVETLRRLRAREDPRFDDYFDEATRTVLDEVHRISNIVTEFTRFARLPQPRPQDMEPEEVSRHVVQIHKASAGEIPLAFVAQRRAPTIRADRDQVIQVLTNLVQNALDAVKDVPGGAVSVSTDTDGHYVAFAVADNGPGIAPEIAARLFEPYATTKATGTGLGLAIAQRIALEHNGELSYVGRSANGRGAVFRLLLPVEGPPPMSEVPGSGA
ncbi:MAG: Nitrogen regulation protein NtrY [Labilithrix sp.]|nr:Nitrogen regulation protein NtrY [Labilithrix sp.]